MHPERLGAEQALLPSRHSRKICWINEQTQNKTDKLYPGGGRQRIKVSIFKMVIGAVENK